MPCNCGSPTDLRVVVIEGDTGGTLLSRAIDATDEQCRVFLERYYTLADSGRWPNMCPPVVECGQCRKRRNDELDAELEYWREKSGQYDDDD